MTTKKTTTVGDKIKELREEMGLSRYAFGKPFHWHSSVIEAWEDGGVDPSLASLRKMAKQYKKPMEYFFT